VAPLTAAHQHKMKRSLNFEKQKREAVKIDRENERVLMRILGQYAKQLLPFL
jgi:hypothetical protein